MRSQSGWPFLPLWLFLAFDASAYGQDVEPPTYELARVELKKLAVKDMKLVVWQGADKKKKRAEVNEFLEVKQQHLQPSAKFDVQCEIRGAEDVLGGLGAPTAKSCLTSSRRFLGISAR